MQTIYLLMCIVSLPMFVSSQSNSTTAGRPTTVSSSYGNQLTTEHLRDVEPASTLIKSDTLILSVLLTTPYLEHPSTSEYKLTPSSVTMVTTNTLDGFVTSSARENINNFLSFTSDKVSFTSATTSNSQLETVLEKTLTTSSSSKLINISASHSAGEIVQSTLSTTFNEYLSSENQIETNTERKDISSTHLETLSMNTGTSRSSVESKYMSSVEKGSLSPSLVLMETLEPTSIMMDLKPSTGVFGGSSLLSDITSDKIKQISTLLMETAPLTSTGVSDGLSTVNSIVSSIMDTHSVLSVSGSFLDEFTSNVLLQSNQMPSHTPLQSISDSTVADIMPSTSTLQVSMVTSDVRKSSLSQETSDSSKISSTVFEETRISVTPTISQQKSSSEIISSSMYSVYKSSFITQTIAANLSHILSASVHSSDSSSILQPIQTTVDNRMDSSSISLNVNASLHNTFSTYTDLQSSTTLTMSSAQKGSSAGITSVNLDKQTVGTSRIEVLSTVTSVFVNPSMLTPLLTTDIFTVSSSSVNDITIGISPTFESLSTSASEQDIMSTSPLIANTASVRSPSVTDQSITMEYQSSFSDTVSSANYPLGSSLIPTNFTTSSLYQETSQSHLQSGFISFTSDVASLFSRTTDTVQSLTILPSFQSDFVSTLYSTAVSGIFTSVKTDSYIVESNTSTFNIFESMLATKFQTGFSKNTVTGSHVMSTPSLSFESLTLVSSSDLLTQVINMSQTLTGPVLTSVQMVDTNTIYSTTSNNMELSSNTIGNLTSIELSLTTIKNDVTSFSNISMEPTITVLHSSDYDLASSFVSSTAMFNASVLSSVIFSRTLDLSSSTETLMSSVQTSTSMMVTMATSKEFHNFSMSGISHSVTPDSTLFSDVYATTKTMGFDTFLITLSTFSQSSKSLHPSTPTISEISASYLVSLNISSYDTSNVAMETSYLLISTKSTSDFESFQTNVLQSSISEISHSVFDESVFPDITSTSDISASTVDYKETSIHPVSVISSFNSNFSTDLIDKISNSSSISDYSFSTINFSQNITQSGIDIQTYSDIFVTMETVSETVSSFRSLTVGSLLPSSSPLIMQTVTASSDQFSLYDNLTKTVQMSSVLNDTLTSLMSVPSVTMLSSYITSDKSSIYLPMLTMSSISASAISTDAFSQPIQSSSLLSSVSVKSSSEIVPTSSTRSFSSEARFSVTSSELILQTMTSSIIVLNSTESNLFRTSIMPTSSLLVSESLNISSQLLMSSNISASVSQQSSKLVVITSSMSSLSSLPISDNVIKSSMEPVTTSDILPSETSSLNMSETILMSSAPILSTKVQDSQTASILPVLSSASKINATSSVPSTSSSSMTTTPTIPPTTTTPNLADTYWVKTVIKVPLAENASTPEFLVKLETRLIQVYNTAYERQQQIAAGTFNPLKKRRRKKRLTKVGDTAIDIKESTRSSGNVSLAYTVEKGGTLVPATEVVQTLGVLSDQEMAIILQYVIASKAETYKKSYDGGTDTTTSSNLWIIGVALGGIVLLIIIIWVILCVVVKKQRASEKSGAGQGEPHLIGMKSPPGEEEDNEFDGTRVNPKYIEELAERGDNSKYSVQSPKRQTYEVNSDYQEEPEYAQVKKTKRSSPNKHTTKKKQSHAPFQGNSDHETVGGMAEDTELIASPSKPKRSGKRRKSKQPGTFEDEEVAAKSYHPVSEFIPHANAISETRQYSADVHDDEGLKKRKEQERKKNKQRIREKKKKERKQAKKDEDIMKEYLASQQEIDTVLEAPPADGLPDVFRDKSSKSLGESKEEMSFSNKAYTEDESLQEARKKMHRLLDDAFSLISPSASMNGSSANVQLNDTLNEEKKHEPLYITPPAYRLGEEPGLATWSPYRAADQVALISMPKKMQTTVVSTDRRSGGKRPVALFNDAVPSQPEILTDEPPKPIILKTRQFRSNKEGEEKKGDHHRRQSYRGSTSQNKAVLNGLESDSAGLTNMKSSSLGSSRAVEKNKNLASSILHSRKASDNIKDNVEMTTLNGDVKTKRPNPHHAPLQVIPDGTDEVDIVSKDVRSSEMPKTTIQSIRNELKSTSLSTSYRPDRRASGTLADIA